MKLWEAANSQAAEQKGTDYNGGVGGGKRGSAVGSSRSVRGRQEIKYFVIPSGRLDEAMAYSHREERSKQDAALRS